MSDMERMTGGRDAEGGRGARGPRVCCAALIGRCDVSGRAADGGRPVPVAGLSGGAPATTAVGSLAAWTAAAAREVDTVDGRASAEGAVSVSVAVAVSVAMAARLQWS